MGKRSADERIAELGTWIDTALGESLPAPPHAPAADFGVDKLLESMRYSLSTPGKRLRPLLILATLDVLGKDPEPFVGFASAIEMIHAYSLIHDDLPAMDDDDLRRGQPTNHKIFGEGMAILAGDGLLTLAAVRMLEPCAGLGDAALQLEVAREIVAAAGFDGMVGGQAADLLAEREAPSESLVEEIHRRKTGALILAAVRAGALLGSAPAEERAALEAFGIRYGLTFQIADDVKDEIAPDAVTGKHGGGDRDAGKMTYPALLGIDGARARCREELDASLAELAGFGERASILESLARDSVAPAFAEHGAKA